MKKLVLISCVKTKRTFKCKARDMYISPLFKKSLSYAQKLAPDQIYILSAKYGLLGLDDEIEPYERTLKTMPRGEQIKWASLVLGQLGAKTDLKEDLFVILAGKDYYKDLVRHMRHVELPLDGMDISQRLHHLGEVE